jgi:hypothetical protein
MLPTIAHRRAAIVPPSVAADPDGLVYLMPIGLPKILAVASAGEEYAEAF